MISSKRVCVRRQRDRDRRTATIIRSLLRRTRVERPWANTVDPVAPYRAPGCIRNLGVSTNRITRSETNCYCKTVGLRLMQMLQKQRNSE